MTNDTNKQLRNTCKAIAVELEAYTSGSLVRCDECGEWVEAVDDHGNTSDKCPECGEDLFRPDDSTFCDWIEQRGEIYGERVELDYCSGYPRYCGVRLLVAYGGPNIWVDTVNGEVRGYWGGDECRVWLDRDACDAIDAYEVEALQCRGVEVE